MKLQYEYYITLDEFKASIGAAALFKGVNDLFHDPTLNFESVLGFSDDYLEDYFSEIYGDRLIGFPLYLEDAEQVQKILGKIKTLIFRTTMANIEKYKAVLSMYKEAYNPIENYSMTEKEAAGSKRDSMSASSTGESSSNSSNSGENTSPLQSTSSTTSQTSTFESSALRDENSNTTTYTYLNNNKSTSSSNASSTSSTQAATTNSFINTQESALGNEYNIGANNEVNDRILTRSGNIGVTTTQQMLQSEIDLKAYNLIEEYFSDIKTKIFLSCF